MTVDSSVNNIEQALERANAKNSSIESDKAVQFANEFKAQILNNTGDQSRSIVALSKLLKQSQPNDAFAQVFNESLINAIFKSITPNTTLEIVNNAISILASVINGSILVDAPSAQCAIPVLNATNTNLDCLEILANKLFLENVDLMINELNFINGYLELDHLKFNSINHLAEFMLHLQKSDLLVILGNLSLDDRFRSALQQPLGRTRSSLQKNIGLLSNLKIDLSSKYQHEVLNIILSQITKTETELKRKLILEKFSVFHLIDLYFFLENTNISFKKSYHQQVLFNAAGEKKFPLPLASLAVSNLLTSIFDPEVETKDYEVLQRFFFLRDSLQYNLISKFLKIWVDSMAEMCDFDNLFELIKLLVKQINDGLEAEALFNPGVKALEICQESTYTKLRTIQLDSFKTHVNDITHSETKKFNKLLNDQTFEFVKNQRFMSLAQGSWVYSQLPSSKDGSFAKVNQYFIILSPNFKQLLYKEFATKSSSKPDIDKTGVSIDISSITNFEIEEIFQIDRTAPPSSNTRLINLIEKTIINKISLLNRKNKVLFTFYAKKDESLVWLDGLNLLIGNFDNLSKELKQQSVKLYNVRKTVQLLNYDEKLEKEISQNSKDESVNENSLEFLETLTKNFYYT